MATPFKMKGFSGFKESPAKQKDFNTKGGKTTTPGYSTTKGANKGLPKNFNTVGTSKAGKFAKIAKKAGKFLGGKLASTLGFLGAGTLSASAGNVRKKSEGEQIKDLLTKHKLKGGKN